MSDALVKASTTATAESGGTLRLLIAGPIPSDFNHYPVRVSELRDGKAIIDGWVRPQVGSVVMLVRGMLAIPAVVTASGGTCFELALRRPVDELALLAAAAMSTPGQARMAPPFPFDPRYGMGPAEDSEDRLAKSGC
jgi:hypothetical protein